MAIKTILKNNYILIDLLPERNFKDQISCWIYPIRKKKPQSLFFVWDAILSSEGRCFPVTM